MIQVITPKNVHKSNTDRLGDAFSNMGMGVAAAIPQFLASRDQANKQSQATKSLSELTGQKLDGLDPEMQAEFLKGHLAQQRALALEKEKQLSKSKFLKEKMEQYKQLLAGNSGQPQMKPNGVLSEEFGDAFPNENRSQQMGNQLKGQSSDSNIPSNEQISLSTLLDPNLGRVNQHQKDVALRENRSEREFEFQKTKASPEYKRDERLAAAQAQADVDYNKQLQETSKQHALKEQSLNRLESLNKKGVTGKPYEKLLEKWGLIALTSDGRREFAADVKNLITDIRSILGAQFTGFEFQTILNAYPSADFSQGANEAIIRNLKDFQDIKSKEVEFAHQLKKENGGKIPEDFQAKVNEKVHEYALTKVPSIQENTRKIMNEEYGIPKGSTLMFDPKGEPLKVPESDIGKYLELGASLP